MEKNMSEINAMLKEAFKIKGLAGRITSNGGDSLFVWGNGFIPRIVARVVPKINRLYLKYERYEKKAEEFAKLYQPKYGTLDVKREYLNKTIQANELSLDEAQI